MGVGVGVGLAAGVGVGVGVGLSVTEGVQARVNNSVEAINVSDNCLNTAFTSHYKTIPLIHGTELLLTSVVRNGEVVNSPNGCYSLLKAWRVSRKEGSRVKSRLPGIFPNGLCV